jgi:16S rRNA (cytosine967-C5)-methyltransferase
MTDIRAIAANLLASTIRDKRAFSQDLSAEQAKLKDKRDINCLNALCFGVVRHYWQLADSLSQLVHKPLKSKDADIEALLMVGLYQLWHMDVPAYAVVSSCVNAAKSLGKIWACGLVNKVLRLALNKKVELEARWSETAQLQFSHPQWLIDELKVAWPDYWERILAVNNEQAPLTLRVQTERISRREYCQLLSQVGIDWVLPEEANQAVCLSNPARVIELPGFLEGLFYVQDLAGQRVVELMDLKPGQRVLDACAAPGSKATHILTKEPKLDVLVALDSQPERLAKITENLQRLRLQKAPVRLVLADALKIQQWWDGQLFDRILLDVPCTATGVIRRHPEIRLCRDPKDIGFCQNLQIQLLEQLWRLLQPGGTLVYTTCSVLPAENDAVIKKLVQADVGAKIKSFQIPDSIKTIYGRQLLPSKNHDGFYYAKLQKAL